MGDDLHDWQKAAAYEAQRLTPGKKLHFNMPRQQGKNHVLKTLKEIALDPDKTWMEKHAPEVLEEEDRLALREELLKLQGDYDSSHEAEQHD